MSTQKRPKARKRRTRVSKIATRLGLKSSLGLPQLAVLAVVIAAVGFGVILTTHADGAPVTGDNTIPKVLPPGPAAATNSAAAAANALGCTLSSNVCYYSAGSGMNSFTATGADVYIDQAKPVVGPHDFHSLAELWVSSADYKQIIEVGWIVTTADTNPHIFVYHWLNGQTTCYDTCGFVANKSAATPVGANIKVGGTGHFSITYDSPSRHWNLYYNGGFLGDFPASLWGSADFTSIGAVNVFGEVAASGNSMAHTQMGNGTPGSVPGSTSFFNLTLLNSTVPANLINGYYATNPAAYSYGSTGPTGFNFGGPGL